MVRKQIPDEIRKQAAGWLARNESDDATEGRAAFEEWLARDLRHRLAYAEADRLWSDSLLLDETATGRGRTLSRAPLHLRRSTHVAALSLAVLAGVGLVTVRFGGTLPLIGIGTSVEAQTYRTLRGETRTWSLPDGSSMTLHGAAQATTRFGKGVRHIEVAEGTARIRVAPNDKRFLEISTAGLVARTRDAVIDVIASPGFGRVAILTGHAQATIIGGNTEALEAGQALAAPARAESTPAPTPASNPQSTVASTAGATDLLGVNGMTVDEAVERLNRANRVQIRLAGEGIGARRLAGAVSTHDPEAFARTVAALGDLEVLHAPDAIVLRVR